MPQLHIDYFELRIFKKRSVCKENILALLSVSLRVGNNSHVEGNKSLSYPQRYGIRVESSFFSPFIFISWRLITLQYCSGFCHILT